ncbi:MAG: hypothetical protein IT222_03005 [Crocinitomix sp.]|nr:hypothetical protein [Crocinitomix sp.]
MKTFTYETKTSEETFHQTIHAIDIQTSVQKWINKISDLKNESYSFNPTQVKNISEQFVAGQITMQFDIKPFYITFKIADQIQFCYINELDKGQPDIIAETKYFKTEDGGRQHYTASGYRPHLKFIGKNLLTTGEQIFIDKDNVFPGDIVKAEIRILSVDAFTGYLYPGQKFDICEGPRTIGHGEIIQVINDKLKKEST